MIVRDAGGTLRGFYDALLEAYGPQGWWPGETRDEVFIGAVLTQNTAWSNVERAIDRLRSAERLSLAGVHSLSVRALADLIRPAGTYRVKARRLKALVDWVYDACDGDLDALFRRDAADLRDALLQVPGVGPETADAILLYAGDVPTFVVDAYTLRVLRRHFLADGGTTYEEAKALFERHVEAISQRYGEYHALLVAVGKRHCRPKAACTACPLRRWPHDESLR